MRRGIIGSPAIIHRLPGGFSVERGISPEEIRFYVLYWDDVAIPGNNLVHLGIPGEEELLAAGALTRPRVQYSGSFGGDQVTDAVLACQAIVASDYAKSSEIDWVLHQFGGEVIARDPEFDRDSLRISLSSVLPVPPGQTPIEDILEFKQRNTGQLRALHEALDEMYFDILSAPDADLAKRKAIANLRDEINAYSAANKWMERWKRFDLAVDFNVRPKDLISGISAGAATGLLTGIAVPLGAVLGGLASVMEIKLARSRGPVRPEANPRFAYLSTARSEKILA